MRRLLLALALVAAPACGSDPASAPASSARLEIHTARGADLRLSVEIADTPAERETGLMGRERLDPFDGMVFTWAEPVRTAFWMKDTRIPLSIAFWDARNRIVALFDMDPCTADPCPTYDPGVEILGAVEVPQGDLGRLGVAVGDEIELTRAT